jgi:hypothetical protein
LGGRYIRQTAESRERLSIIMREKYEKGEHRVFGYKKGDKRIPWNKGLTGVQEPWNKGLAGAQEAWNKGLTGAQEPWNKGLTGSSLREEHKESISNGMKELYRNGYVNHTKGKKYPDRKTTNGMEPWNKGFSAPKYICDYCQREVGGLSNLKRWHNDNCKHKP